MKLWHLEPVKDSDRWEPWYDKAFGFVVRAETEESARALAAEQSGDEGEDAWINPELSTCKELQAEGSEGVVERNFAAA